MESDQQSLVFVHKLYSEGKINDDQRDNLKDMIFNEDAILLSFFSRYSDADQVEDLTQAVITYGNKNAPKSITIEKSDAGEFDNAMSPMDGAIDAKKRRRMEQLEK